MQDQPDTIVVLDFGGQYAQLIARRLRDQGVYTELFPWDADETEVMRLNPKGFVLSGGPASVYAAGAPHLPNYVLASGRPILGICYGLQLLVHHLGGTVAPATEREYGLAWLEVPRENPLIPPGRHQVWMSHGDRVENLPPGFEVIGYTQNSPYAAVGHLQRGYYGVQFHPEVQHTPIGSHILHRFAVDICTARDDWRPAHWMARLVEEIREQVGEERVLAAVSGGVDSAVATALVYKAVGNQLTAVFVDTGLLRQGEREQVVRALKQALGVPLRVVDAAPVFLNALKGVTDPEEKRRIIGETFIRIFEREARSLGHPRFLVQGTIYPDVIESRGPERKHAARIKPHHNVGGLPEDMTFELVEPLRYLFKDEVRRLGLALALPEDLVWKQPFPGPGLAVRCLGEVTPERLAKLRAADAIFREELTRAGYLGPPRGDGPRPISQAFAVLLPVQSVGVMGDQRTYQEVVALRAVYTDDFMTADWAHLPYDLLARVASRIVNEVPGVNRVVYDITTKPPGTIEWE